MLVDPEEKRSKHHNQSTFYCYSFLYTNDDFVVGCSSCFISCSHLRVSHSSNYKDNDGGASLIGNGNSTSLSLLEEQNTK